MTEHDYENASVEEIARQHPSAGDDSQVQGAEQTDNTGNDDTAADGGPGAGEDYAGSGL